MAAPLDLRSSAEGEAAEVQASPPLPARQLPAGPSPVLLGGCPRAGSAADGAAASAVEKEEEEEDRMADEGGGGRAGGTMGF